MNFIVGVLCYSKIRLLNISGLRLPFCEFMFYNNTKFSLVILFDDNDEEKKVINDSFRFVILLLLLFLRFEFVNIKK